jgi:homoserine O-acetyltransferase
LETVPRSPPPFPEIAQKLVTRNLHARLVLVPASMDTYGHGTHTHADVWKNYLIELLKESAKK